MTRQRQGVQVEWTTRDGGFRRWVFPVFHKRRFDSTILFSSGCASVFQQESTALKRIKIVIRNSVHANLPQEEVDRSVRDVVAKYIESVGGIPSSLRVSMIVDGVARSLNPEPITTQRQSVLGEKLVEAI